MGNIATTRSANERTAPHTSLQSNNISQSDEVTTTVGFKMDLRAKAKVEQNAGSKGNGNIVLELPTRPKRQRKQTMTHLDFLYDGNWSNTKTAKSTSCTNASTQSTSKRGIKNTENEPPATRKAALKIAGKTLRNLRSNRKTAEWKWYEFSWINIMLQTKSSPQRTQKRPMLRRRTNQNQNQQP